MDITTEIALLKLYEPLALNRCSKGYIVGYSGGKDSDALVELFFKSGVKFHIIHNHTTIDAPETVYYIRKRFKEFEKRGATTEILYNFDKDGHLKSFLKIVYKKGIFPTRINRFCCSELKEYKVLEYRYAVYSFGVRKSESVKRAKNRDAVETRNNLSKMSIRFKFDNNDDSSVFEVCYENKYNVVNPIVEWSELKVWQFLKECGLDRLNMNPKYSQGKCRVGCIGCPMSTQQKQELKEYPKYKAMYVGVAQKIIDEGRNTIFKNGEEWIDWWCSGYSIEDFFKIKDLEERQVKMFLSS